MSFSINWNQPTPEEEAASAAGLDLAPWVAEQARPIRERHLEALRAEAPEVTQSRVWKIRNGWRPEGKA
jgi:hypothetical protein